MRAAVGIPLGIAAVVLVTLAARYATFDPDAFAVESVGALSLFDTGTVAGLRAIASAKGPSDVGDALATIDVDTAKARADRYAVTMRAMQAAFHRGTGACARYSTREKAPEALVNEAADALVAAHLNGSLTDVARATLAWERDADGSAHAEDEAIEAFRYFTERSGAWPTLGIAMRKDAVRLAFRARIPGTQPAGAGARLSETDRARAAELWAHYGAALRDGAFLVASRKARAPAPPPADE